ncbi:MAG: hypothetical protein KAT34_01620 [Candidatus Aminicenantes bacterium]|nr:hypothetical protein [Candidatus Aminicenantes bacterium]
MRMNEWKKKGFYKPFINDLLTNKKVVAVILVLLILFFGLQCLSQLFFNLGNGKEEQANTGFLKWSCTLSPIAAKPLLEYGYALLQESKKNNDTRMLEKSIRYLKKSINVNMLYYNGHLYLGKAYLDHIVREPTIFDAAVAAFKRAARIRGIDTRVSMDTMTILLSLWPHLNEADREFCTDLFKKSIKRISKEDFISLLDNWALYCRDINFLKEGMNKMPRYYIIAARKLRQLETDMETRREFLAKHTLYFIAELKDLYQQYRSEATSDLLKNLINLYNNLDKRVSTYYLEDTARQSKQKGYLEFKKQVNSDILKLLFTEEGWQKNPRLREKLETYIFSYIKKLSSMDELKGFDDFLDKRGYFGIIDMDLRVFYIKQLLAFKSGQYENVISDTEKFKRSLSFVKKEFAADYADILFLLTDAYVSSRLMIRAYDTLKEVSANDGNLTDYYWRKMIIERVIGPDEGEEKNQRLELITNSRFIELVSPSAEQTVYLVNNKEVNIHFADILYGKINSCHLLQVFIDGSLVFEEYLSKVTSPLTLPISTDQNFSKFTLSIKML